MTKRHKRRTVAQINTYAELQQQLQRVEDDRDFYQGEHVKTLRRALDAEQRLRGLDEQVRLQREIIESLQQRLARSISATEIQPTELRVA